MGYTHYWKRPANTEVKQDKWDKICAGTKDIIEQASVPVQYEYDDAQPPVIDSDLIRFNGCGEGGHETFYVTRKAEQPDYRKDEAETFDFCKTAQKPYDCIVVSVLALMRSIDSNFSLASDGGDEVFENPLYIAEVV